jgi:hypothetical protein
MVYEVNIKWVDDESTQTVLMTDEAPTNGDEDDDIFFYIHSESELEELKTDSLFDFIVLNYEKL